MIKKGSGTLYLVGKVQRYPVVAREETGRECAGGSRY